MRDEMGQEEMGEAAMHLMMQMQVVVAAEAGAQAWPWPRGSGVRRRNAGTQCVHRPAMMTR